jgi:hypothetical protein
VKKHWRKRENQYELQKPERCYRSNMFSTGLHFRLLPKLFFLRILLIQGHNLIKIFLASWYLENYVFWAN